MFSQLSYTGCFFGHLLLDPLDHQRTVRHREPRELFLVYTYRPNVGMRQCVENCERLPCVFDPDMHRAAVHCSAQMIVQTDLLGCVFFQIDLSIALLFHGSNGAAEVCRKFVREFVIAFRRAQLNWKFDVNVEFCFACVRSPSVAQIDRNSVARQCSAKTTHIFVFSRSQVENDSAILPGARLKPIRFYLDDAGSKKITHVTADLS